jgi:hypothetical protein
VNLQLSDLARVLEEELAIGDELRRNLSAQKEAILAWNVAALLEQIEARKVWLSLLGELEERRRQILSAAGIANEASSFRRALTLLANGSAEKIQLLALGTRTRHVFTELQSEEGYLHKLMNNLHSHLEAALTPLLRPLSPTYGEDGIPERPRLPSALLRSRA